MKHPSLQIVNGDVHEITLQPIGQCSSCDFSRKSGKLRPAPCPTHESSLYNRHIEIRKAQKRELERVMAKHPYRGTNPLALEAQAKMIQEKHDRRWNYSAIAVIAFALGIWLGTALTNIH